MYYGLLAPEDKQQAVYQGLMGLGSGLLQGSAPSSTPKGLLGGIGQGLQGFQQGMQGYAGAMQKNKMAQVQMADLEAKRKRQADMDASRAKLMMTDPLKLSDPSSLPLIMGASNDPVAAYLGFRTANQQKDTRTEAQKHAEAMGFQPGTQPYNDYIMDVTKTPPKPDKPDPMFGTGLEGRMYGIYSQGKQHPQYNLAVAHLSQPRTVMTSSGLMTIPAVLGPDGSLLAGGGKPQIDTSTVKYNETEKLTAGFANRAISSGTIMADLESSGYTPSDKIDSATGVTNVTASPERQSYMQAAGDWIRAVLRKESGAVIGADEEAGYMRIYFPVVGDSPAVIKQKAQARKLQELSLKQQAGGAYDSLFGDGSSGDNPVPKLDEMSDDEFKDFLGKPFSGSGG